MKRWHVLEQLIKENGWKAGVELGVYKGQTFQYLLANCPGLKLWGVDLFSTKYYHSTRKGRPPKEFDLEGEYQRIKAWLEKTDVDGKLIRETTVEAAQKFQDRVLDFVFVDADHRYGPVCADIDAWRPKLKRTGMMIGHDYNKAEFPGVVKAVHERFNNVELHADHVWTARS